MPRKDARYWIGVDGEGLGRNPHRYALLAWADGSGHGDSIQNMRGLGSADCLSFLLSTPHNGILAGYYLGYDWTKILKDLPNRAIYTLLRPELRQLPAGEGGGFSWVHWKGFKLHYLAGMMRIRLGPRTVTVWDLGRFFQSPFTEALEAWKVKAPIDNIRAMKAERSGFTDEQFPEIKRYCLTECAALARLAEDLEDAHENIGLRPGTWFGPGSTASVGLKRLRIQERRGGDTIPAEVKSAADRAFFGGRFEHSTIGRYDDVDGWDIVSAYPYHAYQLPCLEHGRWERTTSWRKIERAAHAVLHYRMSDIGAEPWGPLPVRMRNGTILFPRGGCSGWVWREEYRAAIEGWSGIGYDDAWILHSECQCHPFKQILEWFRERIKLGKSAKGRALKLFLNSLYGKLAQTIGRPQYASRIWAGMITSGTRAQLARMICTHETRANVKALATDGLYTTENIRLPAAPLEPDTLGSWERTSYPGVVFVRPGIYWSTDRDDTSVTVKTRGLAKKQVKDQRAHVEECIEAEDAKADVGTSTLFGGARACVYMNPRTGKLKRSVYYGEWHDIPAKISLLPAPKRLPDWSLHMLNGVESAPYSEKVLSDDAKTLQALGDIFWGMR